jgi:hypothetical protein
MDRIPHWRNLSFLSPIQRQRTIALNRGQMAEWKIIKQA